MGKPSSPLVVRLFASLELEVVDLRLLFLLLLLLLVFLDNDPAVVEVFTVGRGDLLVGDGGGAFH